MPNYNYLYHSKFGYSIILSPLTCRRNERRVLYHTGRKKKYEQVSTKYCHHGQLSFLPQNTRTYTRTNILCEPTIWDEMEVSYMHLAPSRSSKKRVLFHIINEFAVRFFAAFSKLFRVFFWKKRCVVLLSLCTKRGTRKYYVGMGIQVYGLRLKR